MGISTHEGDFAVTAGNDEFRERGIWRDDLILFDTTNRDPFGRLVAVDAGDELEVREFREGDVVRGVAVGVVRRLPPN